MPSKSRVLRVQSVRSCTSAVAAIRPSAGGRMRPVCAAAGAAARPSLRRPRSVDRQDAIAEGRREPGVELLAGASPRGPDVELPRCRRAISPSTIDADVRCRRVAAATRAFDPRAAARMPEPRETTFVSSEDHRRRSRPRAPGERSRSRSTPSNDGPCSRYSPSDIFVGWSARQALVLGFGQDDDRLAAPADASADPRSCARVKTSENLFLASASCHIDGLLLARLARRI